MRLTHSDTPKLLTSGYLYKDVCMKERFLNGKGHVDIGTEILW